MGTEFELKYAATPALHRALLAAYPHLKPITMETAYYDDPGGNLSRLRWTLRRRLENGVSVCTLKTPGQGSRCGEWEVNAPSLQEALPALSALGAPKELTAFASAGLTRICAARFTRIAGYVNLPNATLELALDQGVLLGGGREEPLCEVEIELKEGSEEAVLHFAEALAKKYGMVPETRSKAQRAFALAKSKESGYGI